MANESSIEIPPSFISRINTLDKLVERLRNVYDVVVLHDKARTEPRTVLVPTKFQHIPISTLLKDEDIEHTIPAFKHHDEDNFLSMVHVALRIRGDILSHQKPVGIDVSEDKAIDCIPNSLYMFLNLLMGGQRFIEDDVEDDRNESMDQTRILSIAQDIVYTCLLLQNIYPLVAPSSKLRDQRN